MSLIVSVGGAMALKFMSMGMWHASQENYCRYKYTAPKAGNINIQYMKRVEDGKEKRK